MKKQKENSLGNITRSEMGKQNVQAKEVYYEEKPNCFRPNKTRAASFLNGFKNIPEKACVNSFHNNYAFVNVGNLHTRKTF